MRKLSLISMILVVGCNSPTTITPVSGNKTTSSVDSIQTSTTKIDQTDSTTSSQGSQTVVHYLYVASSGNASIAEFYIDDATGKLYRITNNNFIASGSNVQALKLHPNKKYLYAANYGAKTISQYSIDGSTGALTAMSPASVNAYFQNNKLGFDSNGYLYTLLNTNSLGQYTINSDGSLTYVTSVGSGFATTYASSYGIDLTNLTSVTYHGFTYQVNGSNVDQIQNSVVVDSFYAGSTLTSLVLQE